MIRTYTELSRLETFQERLDYLALRGRVGDETFGFDRYINQGFYRSTEWRQTRDRIITRDLGCDLGIDGYDIPERAYIHHMNPMTVDQIRDGDEAILNPEYLICVTITTHNAIHFGRDPILTRVPIVRSPGDTKLW